MYGTRGELLQSLRGGSVKHRSCHNGGENYQGVGVLALSLEFLYLFFPLLCLISDGIAMGVVSDVSSYKYMDWMQLNQLNTHRSPITRAVKWGNATFGIVTEIEIHPPIHIHIHILPLVKMGVDFLLGKEMSDDDSPRGGLMSVKKKKKSCVFLSFQFWCGDGFFPQLPCCLHFWGLSWHTQTYTDAHTCVHRHSGTHCLSTTWVRASATLPQPVCHRLVSLFRLRLG